MYDGNDVVADYTQSSSNGLSLQRTYANGLSVDQKIGRFGPNGTASWHLRDRLNSTSAIVANDGTVQNHYTSNAWGASLNRFENVPNRYTFSGREEDRERG